MTAPERPTATLAEPDAADRLAAELREVRPPQDATGRLARAAAGADLLDVAVAETDTPIGPLLLGVTPRGLVRVAFGAREARDDVLDELARRISPRVIEAPARLDAARRELDEYFDGHRQRFELPLDWTLVRGGFARRVLEATARRGFGVTTCYRDVAAEAGSPGAARAAGNALGSNPIPIVIPCHRVLHASGGLGGYGGGLDLKRFLLAHEGALMPELR